MRELLQGTNLGKLKGRPANPPTQNDHNHKQVQYITLAERIQMATVNIDSDEIKKLFKESNIKVSVVSKMMGCGESTLSSRLSQGKMTEELLEKIATLFSVKKETLLAKPSTEQVLGGVEQNSTEKIISYIQDVGKILTEINREIKELHNDMKTFLTALNTNVMDTTVELHQTAENVRNHSVSTNQNMNKIHNLMKYGGK